MQTLLLLAAFFGATGVAIGAFGAHGLSSVLEANGTSLDKVVKCTVILDSIEDFSAMNSIYKTYFNDNYPARTTFAANLVGGAKIEIEAIAVVE